MKALNSLLLGALICTSHAFTQIVSVNTLQEIREHFSAANEEVLALFDIDMVLVQPQEPAFQMANMKKHSPIIKQIMQEIPSEKREIFFVLSSICSNTVLIDERMPKFLEELTERKIPKIALTGNFTGPFADIEKMEDWKIQRLNELGIDFSKGAPHSEEIIFNKLPTFRGRYSIYTRGVLFVNGSSCSKGEALCALLETTEYLPKQIIFIDDREEHLKSVESLLRQCYPSIEFKGLHFIGAKDYPSQAISEQEFEQRWREIAVQAGQIE